MKTKSGIIIVSFILSAFVFLTSCQPKQEKNECTCPQSDLFAEGEKPDTIFQVGDKQFGLRGHIENGTYSEFIVFDCDNKISFVKKGATKKWTVYTEDDNLVLGEFFEFGDDKLVWATETIKFDDKELSVVRKFNKEAIALFADEFEKNTPDNIDLSKVSKEDVLMHLFWGSVRDEKLAKELFKTAEKDLELDGAYKELYLDLSKKLEEYFD